MTNEQQLIINCLSDHLHSKKPTTCDIDLDWSKIDFYSRQHQLEGIICYQCGEKAIEELEKTAIASCAYNAVQREQLLSKIRKELLHNEVEFLLFKGVVLKNYYPVPALRTMGDIDILVHENDKNRVNDILTDLGLEAVEKGTETWAYRINGIIIEIHHELIYNSEYKTKNYPIFLESVWETAKTEDNLEYIIEPEIHFAYLILHIRKHILDNM